MSEIKPLDQQLTIIDEEGNEILCQILFTFESEEFKKNYVLFYPLDDSDDEENVTVMAASYVENEDGTVDIKIHVNDPNGANWGKGNMVDGFENGFDPDFVIRTEDLYDVRAIPSLYLLDADKTVIMKDAPENRVFRYLASL